VLDPLIFSKTETMKNIASVLDPAEDIGPMGFQCSRRLKEDFIFDVKCNLCESAKLDLYESLLLAIAH